MNSISSKSRDKTSIENSNINTIETSPIRNNSLSPNSKKQQRFLLPRISCKNSDIFSNRYPSAQNPIIEMKRKLYLTETSQDNISLPLVNAISPLTSTELNEVIDPQKYSLITKLSKKYINKKDSSNKQLLKVYKPLKVKYSVNDFINKTREILLLKYSLEIKKETKKRMENNILKEISGVDETIKSLEKYKENFEEEYSKKYLSKLRELNKEVDNEREKEWNIYQNKLKIIDENNQLIKQIAKKEIEKESYEKWIRLQLKVRNGIDATNVKEEILKFPNGIIYRDADDFLEEITVLENKNIHLLNEYKEIKEDLSKLKQQMNGPYKLLENTRKEIDDNIEKKELIVKMLKEKNKELTKKKNEVIKYSNITNLLFNPKKAISSVIFKDKEFSHFQLTHPKSKDPLFDQIYYTYLYVKNNLQENLDNIDVKVDKFTGRQEKILGMLCTIERGLNFAIDKYHYYISIDEIRNEIKEVEKKIELSNKKEKAIQMKKIEVKKFNDLTKSVEKKSQKVAFIPNRFINRYPYQKFINTKNKKKVDKKNDNPQLSDFLYETGSNFN